MVDRSSLYQWEKEDLSDLEEIEKETLKKAVELNDKLIDAKTLLDDISYDWNDFVEFLENERISKSCEFHGLETIQFSEELLNAVVNTLKESLNNTKKSIDYNSKKIKINRVIDG